MATVELAVVTSWPRQRIENGDLDIKHTLRIHLPFIPAGASIASYLLYPADSHVLFWQENRQSYGKLDLARPISVLFSSSMRSLPAPLLLVSNAVAPLVTTSTRLSMEDADFMRSDDVHLLPSSHTGDTPPRQPFLQRIHNARTTPTGVNHRRPSRTPRSSPTLLGQFGGSDLFPDDATEAFDYDEMSLMQDDEFAINEVGICVDVDANTNTTTWRIVLHRADKEAAFLQFFHDFCNHRESISSCIKIHMTYVGETGVGDGLVVEMLSYIWKYLFEETHHFVAVGQKAKGYYIPTDHPDTCLMMSHLGLFAAVSLSYSVCPHGLHPMFLRRTDQDDYKSDALLYNADICCFVPSSYKVFVDDRKDLSQYWNDEHHFDRRVMPLERVNSEDVFEKLIIPEMYKCIIFPTALVKRNLDTFRHHLFEYVQRERNGISVAMVEDVVERAYDKYDTEDLIAMFHLSPEDTQDFAASTSMRMFYDILKSYPLPRIQQLMVYVTNKAYPTPILVRFRDKSHISTCLSILQLRNRDVHGIAEELDIILAVDLPNIPYHEQD